MTCLNGVTTDLYLAALEMEIMPLFQGERALNRSSWSLFLMMKQLSRRIKWLIMLMMQGKHKKMSMFMMKASSMKNLEMPKGEKLKKMMMGSATRKRNAK